VEKKSPAGDKRIMRMKKGAIFSPSPLSSQKFKTADVSTLAGNVWKLLWSIRRVCTAAVFITCCLWDFTKCSSEREPAFMYDWLLSVMGQTGYRDTKIKVYVLSICVGLNECDIHFLTKCVRKSSIQNDEHIKCTGGFQTDF